MLSEQFLNKVQSIDLSTNTLLLYAVKGLADWLHNFLRRIDDETTIPTQPCYHEQ